MKICNVLLVNENFQDNALNALFECLLKTVFFWTKQFRLSNLINECPFILVQRCKFNIIPPPAARRSPPHVSFFKFAVKAVLLGARSNSFFPLAGRILSAGMGVFKGRKIKERREKDVDFQSRMSVTGVG
jgi:hypothetical protein